METHDPREIPILTDAIEDEKQPYGFFDVKAVHAAFVAETLKLTDSLLHQAFKEIEAAVFERVFDQLRAQLPELLDRILRESSAINGAAARYPEAAAASAPSGEPGARP